MRLLDADTLHAAQAALDFQHKGSADETLALHVAEQWRGSKPAFDIVDAKSGEVVFAAGTKISPRAANKAEKDGNWPADRLARWQAAHSRGVGLYMSTLRMTSI